MAKSTAAEVAAIRVEPRDSQLLGSGASRRLRRSGQVPAVLYGRGQETVPLSVARRDLDALLRHGAHGLLRLELNGNAQDVLIKDLQWDAFGEEVIHVDFIRVTRGEMVTVEIPVTLRGQAQGVKEGGVQMQRLYAVELDCPVESIPESIVANVSHLRLGDSFKLRDLPLPPNCQFHKGPRGEEELEELLDQLVVEVSRPLEVVEEVEVPTAAEPELIAPKKPTEAESAEES